MTNLHHRALAGHFIPNLGLGGIVCDWRNVGRRNFRIARNRR